MAKEILPIWSSERELEKSGIIVKANIFYQQSSENYFGNVSHFFTSEDGMEMGLPVSVRNELDSMQTIIEKYLNEFTEEFGIRENKYFKETIRG